MTYRTVTLENGEQFRVRISDEAIGDWLNDRDWLKAQGRPDRPPDWDNGPTRGWYPHPGEEHLRWWAGILQDARQRLAGDSPMGQFPVLVAVWRMAHSLSKYIVQGYDDGSFTTELKLELTADDLMGPIGSQERLGARRYGTNTSPNTVGAAIESELMRLDRLAVKVGAAGPDITFYEEFEQEADRHGQVRAEVIAEFGYAQWGEPLLGPRPDGVR